MAGLLGLLSDAAELTSKTAKVAPKVAKAGEVMSIPAEIAAQFVKAADPAHIRGAEIMDMLKSGRGSEVTEQMLDMGDPALNARLSEYLYRNYDLPMDEASRMARAGEMEANMAASHATKSSNDFQIFKPSWRGTNYFAVGPDEAMRGANAGAQEFGSGGVVTAQMPVMLKPAEISGLTMGKTVENFYNTLPHKIIGEDEVDAAMQNLPKGYGLNWDNFYQEKKLPSGKYEYTLKPIGQTFEEAQSGYDELGMRFGGWNSGSDANSLRRAQNENQQGFLVSDEAGVSAAMGPDAFIRSRFARFDPRLSHLKNLSASVGAGLLGAGMMPKNDGRR